MKKTWTTMAAALLAGALHGHAVAQTAPAAGGAPGNLSTQPNPAAPCNPKECAHMRSQLDDWAALGHYRADNAALPPLTPGVPRIVFYGDSITDFWGRGADNGSFFPGKGYINRGISGETTPQMLVRFEQDVVHLHPAVVVILAGTNDIAGNTGPSTPEMIEDNYTAMTKNLFTI